MSIIRDVVFLILFSLILPALIGVDGIFWAAPAADILAVLVTAAVLIRVWRQLDGDAAG